MSTQATSQAFPQTTNARVMTQGGIVFSGGMAAQLMSLGRNAILAQTLSMGDYGTAALLLVALQTIEMLSDLAIERMIIRDPDGDDPRTMAVGHALQIARGILLFTTLICVAPLLALAFQVPNAQEAFAALALIPLIKGFQHLDIRRFHRHYQNVPVVWFELVPQAAALLLTPLVLATTPTFEAVVVLATIQAGGQLVASHHLAERPYRVNWDSEIAGRFIVFGGPILLSAIPLVAVLQGDRIIVAQFFTLDHVAAYSVAVMITMLPTLLASRVSQTLFLALLASANHLPTLFRGRYRVMLDAMTFFVIVYAVGFWCLGGPLVATVFGDNFSGLGNLTAVLAMIFALRTLQSVPTAVLLARGETMAHLGIGIVRAFGLLLALAVAIRGEDLVAVAAAGIVGELAALMLITYAMARQRGELAGPLMRRALLLVLFVFVVAFNVTPPTGASEADVMWLQEVPTGVVMTLLAAVAAVFVLPTLRRAVVAGRAPNFDMTALDAH